MEECSKEMLPFSFRLDAEGKQRIDTLMDDIKDLMGELGKLDASKAESLKPITQKLLGVLHRLSTDLVLVHGNINVQTTRTHEG